MSDSIDRDSACKALMDDCHIRVMSGNNWIRLEEAVSKLCDLPSAQPEKRTEKRTETHAWDCISRQAVIEVINAVFPVDPMKSEYAQGIACGAALAKTYVEQLPSVQPEIIRCKDCKNQEKFFQKDGRRKDGGYYIYGCSLAEGYSHVCLDDDYCSRAERRTDE